MILLADGAGWLGWRPALRSTAVQVLQNGVMGKAETFEKQGGFRWLTLDETLANMPATLQDRWFACMYLLLPISVLVSLANLVGGSIWAVDLWVDPLGPLL